jgi:hypothetical protein
VPAWSSWPPVIQESGFVDVPTYAFASVAQGGYSAAQSIRKGDILTGVLSALVLAGGLAASAEQAIGTRAGTGDEGYPDGRQLAQSDEVANDAQHPAAGQTAEPELQPGDRTRAMIVSEELNGARVRSMITNYTGVIHGVAAETNTDEGLIRAIIYEEQTHLLPGEGIAERFGVGRTVGLGQVTVGYHGFSREQLLSPATNIRAIATHLAHLQQQPLVAPNAPIASLATRYNCGTCTTITPYGRRVVWYRSQHY